MQEHAVDLLVRILCIITLIFCAFYDEGEYNRVELGFFSPESQLSLTVLLLWIRKLSILRVWPVTGSLVFMLGKMLRDTIAWALVYAIGLVGFAAAFKVLFHNKRAAIGVDTLVRRSFRSSRFLAPPASSPRLPPRPACLLPHPAPPHLPNLPNLPNLPRPTGKAREWPHYITVTSPLHREGP